jgi:hypothetical protein
VFILRGLPNESVEFKGLQIKLDGVDPNNVFWVSSRTEARLLINANSGQPNKLVSTGITNNQDPRLSDNKRIILSGVLPPELQSGGTYYVINRSGSTFQLSRTQGGPIEIFTSSPSFDVRLAAEPSFVFEGLKGRPNIITGNFLGYTNSPTAAPTEDNTTVFTVRKDGLVDKDFNSFRGVRFLGLWGDATKINNETLFVAMTSVDEPALLPVLQLNVPNASGGSDNISQPNPRFESGINGTPEGTSTDRKGQWTIRPRSTEINVYFVAGSTPSRNGVPYQVSTTRFNETEFTPPAPDATPNIGETGGGLANFVRFIENWQGLSAKITGGFIQNTKSRFATAPFVPAPLISGVADTTTIFLNPAFPGTGQTDGRSISGFNLQYMSRIPNRIPYYTAPIRLWGYDVGLLTQQPDRFAERFAVPIPGANEYFREVTPDDPWVEALLCALEPTNITTANKTIAVSPNSYTRRVLRGSDLRKACDEPKYGTTTPLANPAQGNPIPGIVYP